MFNIANLFGVFAFVGRKNIHMDELMPPNAFLPAAQKTLHRLGEIVDIGIYGIDRSCWRCGRTSVAITNLCPLDCESGISLVESWESIDMCYARELLEIAGHPAARQIKYRSSRRAGRYMSNGCAYCDAFSVNFCIDEDILDGQRPSLIASVKRPLQEWAVMVTQFHL
ncbi:hypothetical protein [Bifidobacterium bifidum]|uniref:hypothetical protein n=1 Tax=Bifidobacterium bifidum TaxID=1681 RepID=UPI0009BAC179|nr:hypothetical protein [Bifidobacterium bifidum]